MHEVNASALASIPGLRLRSCAVLGGGYELTSQGFVGGGNQHANALHL
jgi:hypothetical protein